MVQRRTNVDAHKVLRQAAVDGGDDFMQVLGGALEGVEVAHVGDDGASAPLGMTA